MILVADVQRALLQLLELAFRVGVDGVRVRFDRADEPHERAVFKVRIIGRFSDFDGDRS